MTENNTEPVIEGDPADDEVDVEPFEGEPDFEEAPWADFGNQDDEVSS